jgi:hypothetical protein
MQVHLRCALAVMQSYCSELVLKKSLTCSRIISFLDARIWQKLLWRTSRADSLNSFAKASLQFVNIEHIKYEYRLLSLRNMCPAVEFASQVLVHSGRIKCRQKLQGSLQAG